MRYNVNQSIEEMPMLKVYPKITPSEEVKHAPNSATINTILNYSKSIEVKDSKTTKRKLLLNLN